MADRVGRGYQLRLTRMPSVKSTAGVSGGMSSWKLASQRHFSPMRPANPKTRFMGGLSISLSWKPCVVADAIEY